MNLDILSDRTSYDRKHDTRKGNQRNRTTIKSHIFEDEENDRYQYGYLRKSSDDQRSAKLVHPPENLQRQLLDTRIHETRRKNKSKRQSSNQIWIGRIRRKQIRNDDSNNVHQRHNNQSRTDKSSIFRFKLCMIRIFFLFFDSS